jgi:IS5 family transposase
MDLKMPKQSPCSKLNNGAQLSGYATWLYREALPQRFHGPLAEIAGHLRWGELRNLIAPVVDGPRQGGPVGHDPLALLAAVLLGRWHRLSDRALADALGRRTDFIHFCGFAPDTRTPSASTIGRFERALVVAGVLDKALAAVDAALVAAGLEIRPAEGALVDIGLKRRGAHE